MIITRIIGGLGNQMFQYAVGRSLSLSTGHELKLDLRDMGRYKLRRFALHQFQIEASVACNKDLPRSLQRGGQRILTRILRPAQRIRRVDERTCSFDRDILSLEGSVYISGYWQTEKYFIAHADIIRSDFALSVPISPLREQLLRRIREENSISVHVRRGDYISNPVANAIHGTCEPEWYSAAMSRMEEKFRDVTYFIFSDDPIWSRENIKSHQPLVFVEPQDDGQDAQDMHLMASCRGHIIANSSFSWWGAWLGQSPEKHVIAPLRWFRDPTKETNDLIPEAWEKL